MVNRLSDKYGRRSSTYILHDDKWRFDADIEGCFDNQNEESAEFNCVVVLIDRLIRTAWLLRCEPISSS